MSVVQDLQFDHKMLDSARATRRYFAKFERIMSHLSEVTILSNKEKLITTAEAKILLTYLDSLTHTFTALSYKFLMSHRIGGSEPSGMSIDKTESGFPVFGEVLQMASDATQAKKTFKVTARSGPSEERYGQPYPDAALVPDAASICDEPADLL